MASCCAFSHRGNPNFDDMRVAARCESKQKAAILGSRQSGVIERRDSGAGLDDQLCFIV